MKRWGTSIRVQIWTMVLACLSMVAALIVINTKAELGHERDLVGKELQRRGTATAELLAGSVEPGGDTEATLTSLAGQPGLTQGGKACNDALAAIQPGIDIGYLDVIDAQGRVTCSSSEERRNASPPPYREVSSLLLRVLNRSAGTDAAFPDPWTGELSMFTVVPLETEHPASLVYVGGTQDFLVPDDTATDLETLVVDPLRGQILMRSPEPQGAVGSRVSRDLGKATRADGATSAVGVDGVRRLYRQMPLGKTRFTVLVGQEEATAYASAREGLVRNTVIGVILILVVGLLGLLLHRRIARPTYLLRRAIQSVAAGGTERAPTSGPSELSALGVAFNDMVEQQRRADGRFRAIVQHASDYVLVVDAERTVTYAGPAATATLGVQVGDDSGALLRLVHPDDRGRVATTLTEWLADSGDDLELRLRVVCPDGEERVLDASAQDLLQDDAVSGVVLTCRDVTERSRFEEHLAHQARHDPLSGLPNRAAVLEQLAALQGTPLAVLFLDLDRFKLINDSHGHTVGDKVLVALGRLLHSALRPGDVISRFGGDEFVMVAPGVDTVAAAEDLAARIQVALSAPLLVDGRELFVSGSIGIALSAPGDTPEALLRHADTAMYRAKAQGRNCYAAYDDEMREEALRLLRTESGLHRALEREELLLEYQPVLSLADGRVLGAEALVRWRHPEHGLVRPDEFIPVAEETGLIVAIGEWVLREACSWAAATEGLRVSVNVSARQLARPDFLELVQDALLTSGLPARGLCLEVTETLLVQDAETASVTLTALRELGVRIAIDDFGTGWSSLSYLRQFPVDEIKLDRSYVSEVTLDTGADTIVGSLVGMAHAMGLSVTAEGVETPRQHQFLEAIGCDTAQGYLFARPTTPESVVAMAVARGKALV